MGQSSSIYPHFISLQSFGHRTSYRLSLKRLVPSQLNPQSQAKQRGFNAENYSEIVYYFSSSLPSSIVATISRDSPENESSHESCEEWLKKYDNHIYRNSVFYKGPLLLLSCTIENNLSPASFLTLRAYKNNVKDAILKTQSMGNQYQWENENLILYNIKGLRKSKTEYRTKINYSELQNVGPIFFKF